MHFLFLHFLYVDLLSACLNIQIFPRIKSHRHLFLFVVCFTSVLISFSCHHLQTYRCKWGSLVKACPADVYLLCHANDVMCAHCRTLSVAASTRRAATEASRTWSLGSTPRCVILRHWITRLVTWLWTKLGSAMDKRHWNEHTVHYFVKLVNGLQSAYFI